MENAGVFDDEKHVQYVANCADDLFFVYFHKFISTFFMTSVVRDEQRFSKIGRDCT